MYVGHHRNTLSPLSSVTNPVGVTLLPNVVQAIAFRFLIEATCNMRLLLTRVRLVTRRLLIGRLDVSLRLKVRRKPVLRRAVLRVLNRDILAVRSAMCEVA